MLQAWTEVYHQVFGGWEVQTIYWRIHDLNGEACFSQKIFANGLNMGLPQQAWAKNRIQEVETH